MDIEEINAGHLPSESELERLANQFFSAVPGSLPASDQYSSFQHENYGSSPQRENYGGGPQREHNQSGPVGQPLYSLRRDEKHAGNPVDTKHQDSFNLEDPQTSLPDPHFYNGEIPKSVAGSGISPSARSFGYGNGNSNQQAGQSDAPHSFSQHFLPYQEDQSFESELREALGAINSYFPGSQFAHAMPAGPGDASFYFMNGGGLPNDPLSAFHQPSRPAPTSQNSTGLVKPPFDINFIKADFPILKERVSGGKRLIWLDNAATTQKPRQVIERLNYFYEHENSNIHRAAHELAARATDAYESARKKVQVFLNAASPKEIVFVRGTTEGINLVAASWGDQHLKEGDEVIISHLEHHANIVPWQMLAAKKRFKLRIIPVDDSGQIILEEYGKLLNPKTKLVAFTWVSNALGTITPAKIMIEMAHAVGAKVLLDGAQSVSHIRTDVQSLNPDWFVFSGHKVFGPTGIGVVYGKEELLNATQPYQGGGNMIQDVTFEETKYQKAPERFEAGTANIADAVGLGAAIDYVSKIGIDLIFQYEHALLNYATGLLKDVPGIRLIGTAAEKTSVASFVLKGYKTEDVGAALSDEGIAVRSGHHCAQPILRRFGLESSVRPSLAFYNTCADIDALVAVLYRLKKK